MSILTVRQALADAVSAVVPCDPYTRDAVTAPGAYVNRGQYDPRYTMQGTKNPYEFTITVYVPRADEVSAQQMLDGFCAPTGANSIKLAIEAYAWSGIADYGEVTQIGPTVETTVGGVAYFAVVFTLTIIF